MMKEAMAALWKLATGDLTPAERGVLVKVWAKMGWRLILGLHILYACGWLATFGFAGFARADSLDKMVDRKIEAATKPLAEKVGAQSAILQGISQRFTDQVANSTASEIRYLIGKRCKEVDSAERDRLQREIDRKQAEFYELKKHRYEFGCGDV